MSQESLRKFLYMDKRIIYLLMGIAIAVPMFFPIGLPVTVLKSTQDFYNEMEKLHPRDIVWVACEFSPSQTAEFQPVIMSIFKQCFDKDLRIVISAFSTQGPGLGMEWAKPMVEEYNAVYGVDYINIGYRASMSTIMDNARRDLIDAYSDRDAYQTPLQSFPIMADLTKASDISMVIIFTGGSPGCGEYISNWQTTGDVMNMITVASAVQIPVENVLYQAGMLQGMIGGMSGAAAYEKLTGRLGAATQGLDSQGLGHLVIIVLIIIGNIAYFWLKRLEEQAKVL